MKRKKILNVNHPYSKNIPDHFIYLKSQLKKSMQILYLFYNDLSFKKIQINIIKLYIILFFKIIF